MPPQDERLVDMRDARQDDDRSKMLTYEDSICCLLHLLFDFQSSACMHTHAGMYICSYITFVFTGNNIKIF